MKYFERFKKEFIESLNYQEYHNEYHQKKMNTPLLGLAYKLFIYNKEHLASLVALETDLKEKIPKTNSIQTFIVVLAENIANCISYQNYYKADNVKLYSGYIINTLEKTYAKVEKNSYDFVEILDLIKRAKALPSDWDILTCPDFGLKIAIKNFLQTGNADEVLNSYFSKKVIKYPSLFDSRNENTMFRRVDYEEEVRIEFKKEEFQSPKDIKLKNIHLTLFAMKHSHNFQQLPPPIKAEIITFVAEETKKEKIFRIKASLGTLTEKDIIIFLKSKGDINSSSPEYGLTALHHAVKNCRKETADILVKYNAKLFLLTKRGNSAFDYISYEERPKLVKLQLLELWKNTLNKLKSREISDKDAVVGIANIFQSWHDDQKIQGRFDIKPVMMRGYEAAKQEVKEKYGLEILFKENLTTEVQEKPNGNMSFF